MKDFHKHNIERVLNSPMSLGQAKKHSRISSNLLRSNTSSRDSTMSTIDVHDTRSTKHNSGLPANKVDQRKHFVMLSLLIVAIIIVLISTISIMMLPTFVSHQIAKKLVLKNGSMLLDRWSKPNIPMYFRVWVFDVVNAKEVSEKKGVKPELREIGPFTFKLKRNKDIVSFASDNLYYTERRLYHFMPELSCCAINTTVTIPNIPLVAVVERALSYQLPVVSRFVPRLINRAIQSLREQLFIKRQVREILFDGYDVQLLKMISRLGSIVGLPQTQQRFAILKGKNNTWRPELDGIWAINTGEKDPKKFGKVHSWNSYRKLPFWAPNSQCNAINGSDGTLFVPPISREEPLYIFNQEICRSITLVFQRPSEIRQIEAYRFGLNPLNFARTMQPSKSVLLATATQQRDSPGPSASPGEQEQLVREAQQQEARMATRLNPYPCFCDRKSTNLNGINVCEFDGLIDMSKCNKQAQAIFGSMPHFYNTDSRLLENVSGLTPNATRHQTFVDIEPNTGIVLGGKRRVQLNLMIKHNNEVDGFTNINDMLVPLVWFEESATITEETAEKFRSNYTYRVRRMNTVLTSILLGAIILAAINLKLLASSKFYRNSYCWKLNDSNVDAETAPSHPQLANEELNKGFMDQHSKKPSAPLLAKTDSDSSSSSSTSSAPTVVDNVDMTPNQTNQSRGALNEKLKEITSARRIANQDKTSELSRDLTAILEKQTQPNGELRNGNIVISDPNEEEKQ